MERSSAKEYLGAIGTWLGIGVAAVIGIYALVKETNEWQRVQARRETALLLARDVVDRNHNGFFEPEERLDALRRLGYQSINSDDRLSLGLLDTEQLEDLTRSYQRDGIYPNYQP